MTTHDLLPPLPASWAPTRDALHQLAFFALAPRRHEHADRLGLRATPGGFGTPTYSTPDGRERVRVWGTELVVETESGLRRHPIRTVRAACEVLGVPYREAWFEDFHDPLTPADPDEPLAVDATASAVLARWFAFGTALLEEVRTAPWAVATSEVQLWPEHFDPATEHGDVDAGLRASLGASPGDAGHTAPYLYVAPWGEVDDDPFWDADHAGFDGALLSYGDLRGSDDPLERGLDFLRTGALLLTG